MHDRSAFTEIKNLDRSEVGDLIARQIAPQAWAEYDDTKGIPSNMAGWACIESIHAAGRVMDMLRRRRIANIPAHKKRRRR